MNWARTYGGTDWDWPLSVVQAPDEGFVISGSTRSFTIGEEDILVIKTRADGSVEWARAIGGTGSDMAYSMTRDQTGGYVITGMTNYDLFALKLSSDGSLVWSKTLTGTSTDRSRNLIQAQDGGFVITGETASYGGGGFNFFLVKLDRNGNYPGCLQEWSPSFREAIPSSTSPTVGQNYSPTVNTPTLTTTTPSLNTTNICVPVDIREWNVSSSQGIICSPIAGGLLFKVSEDMPLKIYSSDGRLAYATDLRKGENRIDLKSGVWLWQAGQYKGKAVVN